MNALGAVAVTVGGLSIIRFLTSKKDAPASGAVRRPIRRAPMWFHEPGRGPSASCGLDPGDPRAYCGVPAPTDKLVVC